MTVTSSAWSVAAANSYFCLTSARKRENHFRMSTLELFSGYRRQNWAKFFCLCTVVLARFPRFFLFFFFFFEENSKRFYFQQCIIPAKVPPPRRNGKNILNYAGGTAVHSHQLDFFPIGCDVDFHSRASSLFAFWTSQFQSAQVQKVMQVLFLFMTITGWKRSEPPSWKTKIKQNQLLKILMNDDDEVWQHKKEEK